MSVFNSAEASGLEIAIIGMSGRFPGAPGVQDFWNGLRNGVEGITFFSSDEIASESVADVQSPDFVNAGGVLGDATQFDAGFFGINPREAELMDPQHRVFMECALAALEDAGYAPATCPEATGVYAGAGVNRYVFLNILGNHNLVQSAGIFQIAIGNEKDFLSTQVSYRLNLRGPSMSVQTACSTSLVAIHQACQGLISGEADLAIAGGVSILVPEKSGYIYQEGGIDSPDGHCRPFDAKAAGTVRSNGAGAVVLKRLSDAVAARDNILAVIKGSAVNNDGSRKTGFTAPSIQGQVRVIMAAQAMAGVSPETIQYVEAHGTGTSLGDPIEMKALTEAFRQGGDRRRSACAVGSVKSNVGHLDTAAGVCGVIKTVLALQHEEIPPLLHFEEANPELDIEESPFYVNAKLQRWPRGEQVRRAGVSSFGIGGTNAHVVLEEAPDVEPSDPGRDWKLVVLSARSDAALARVASNLVEHVRTHQDLNLADAAFTLAVGRKQHRVRSAVVARDLEELCDKLESGVGVQKCEASPDGPNVVFMFPGQGAQYQAMGRQLYETLPEFMESVDKCIRLLPPRLRPPLKALLKGDISELELQQTQLTQVAMFVVEYNLAQLWLRWGVEPKSMIGHSIGEYVAACLAGVMSLEEALRLVSRRGQLMQSLPPAGMLHFRMSEQEARDLLPPGLDIAVVNGPQSCVVAGPEDALSGFQEELQKRDCACTRLKTSHAFHSAMTEPILRKFREAITRIKLQPPRLPFISNVTGTWITPEQAQSPDYWVQHLRHTVRFGDGIGTLLKQPDTLFLEVGPGRTLSQLVLGASQSAKNKRNPAVVVAGINPKGEYVGILESVGRLWTLGVPVGWPAFYQTERRSRVSLPSYPFERQPYYLEPAWGKTGPRFDTERRKLEDWFYLPSWKRSLAPTVPPAEEQVPGQEKTCILFTDGENVGSDLGLELEREGWQVVWINAAGEFRKIDSTHFEMRPGSEDDWMLLVDELKDVTPQGIAHFWNASARCSEYSLEQMLDRSFYSLLYLAKAMATYTGNSEVSVLVGSCALHAVEGQDHPDPRKATLLGPCRVLSQEFPGLRCTSVDVPHTEQGSSDRQRVVEQLFRELCCPAEEPVVAYRGAHRWVPSWEDADLRAIQPARSLHDDGVYLITGGLGGIGLEIADYLSTAVKAPRLLLLGRSSFPAPDQWESWIMEHVASDETYKRIRRIQKMQANGAVVQVIVADVASESEMARVRDQIAQSYGALNGIVHAAGVAGGGLLQLRSREDAGRVMAPKINGTLHLHKLFPDVEFLVLCSSVTAALGGIGQADYCAANAFMDAFAVAHSGQKRTRIVSMNWDAWQEVGMAARTAVPREWEADRARDLQNAIKPVEGVKVFEMLLGSNVSQMLVSTRDFSERVREAQATQLSQEAETKAAGSRYPRPASAGPYEPAAGDLERTLSELWAELLAIEPVGRNDNFFELGGHSLLAIQLISRVREVFRVDVQMGSIFENPTPAVFADMLRSLESQPGEMEQIAQVMNAIDQMSESEIMEALEQGRLGATQK